MRLISRVKDWFGRQSLGSDARAVLRDRLTYLPPAKFHRLERALSAIAREGVDGDLLEFGIALGGSAVVIAGHLGETRDFHGFDVFAMIPPPTSDKDDDKSKERYEAIKGGQSTGIGGDRYYGYRDNLFDEVKATFARYGRPVDGERIQLHKGLFEDTWPHVEVDRVAFAHIDCDWYDPVKFCLEAVDEKLSPGGLILIDDYNDYGGARTAVDEFLAARPGYEFEAGVNPILRKHG